MTQRMIPSVTPTGFLQGKNITISGRSYTAVAGTPVDAPDQDAAILGANNWVNCGGPNCIGVGTTAQRPTTDLFADAIFLDTTLGYGIVYDGATWRNPATGAAA